MDCINECHQVIRHESEKPCKIDVHFTLGAAMTNPIAWANTQIKRLHPKRRGLGLMTLGFLCGLVGALFAYASAYMFQASGLAESFTKQVLVGFGWLVMLLGTAAMVIGIIWHWLVMWGTQGSEK